MTRQYEPEGWVMLQIETEEEVFYKIFGTWRGGYLDGDSWRLSSGATNTKSIVDHGDFIEWPQASGSIYKLHKDGENGYTMYTRGILDSIIKNIEEQSANVKIVKLINPISKEVESF